MKFLAFARKIAPFTVALAAMSACATASAREIGALTDAQTPTPIDMWSIVGFTLLAAGGIASAGLLSGLETGVYSLSRLRLSIRAARGDARAALLAREYARPGRLLSTLLVSCACAGWLASFGTSQVLDALGFGPVEAVLLDLAILLPTVFLFGEVLPKDLFRVHADRWMPQFAGVLRVLRVVLCVTGIVPLVAGIAALATRMIGGRAASESVSARARIAALLAEGAGVEGLSETQLGFADRVFTMRDITVLQEMRPWKSVAMISEGCLPAERARVFLASGVSRLPVVNSEGIAVGVVGAADHIAQPNASTMTLCRKPLLVRGEDSALEAIQSMRRGRVQIAVVADRAGRPIGIVSMKDLVEPLIGDLSGW